MSSKIVIALNDQPKSQRALRGAINLARPENAKLTTVSILEDLPAYTSFAIVVDPGAPNAMMENCLRFRVRTDVGSGAQSSRNGCNCGGP